MPELFKRDESLQFGIKDAIALILGINITAITDFTVLSNGRFLQSVHSIVLLNMKVSTINGSDLIDERLRQAQNNGELLNYFKAASIQAGYQKNLDKINVIFLIFTYFFQFHLI